MMSQARNALIAATLLLCLSILTGCSNHASNTSKQTSPVATATAHRSISPAESNAYDTAEAQVEVKYTFNTPEFGDSIASEAEATIGGVRVAHAVFKRRLTNTTPYSAEILVTEFNNTGIRTYEGVMVFQFDGGKTSEKTLFGRLRYNAFTNWP